MFDPNATDNDLLDAVVTFYQQSLSDDAHDYLRRKGLDDEDAVSHFRIGFADRSLGRKIPSKDTKAGRDIRARLEQLGVFRSSGHEHFTGCVVFPIRDTDGNIVDIYGRKILGRRLRRGTDLDLHLNDQRLGVWNYDGIRDADEVILCANVLDALAFWIHGHRNVTCSFSPDVVPPSLSALIQGRRVLVDTVTLSDDAIVLPIPNRMSVHEFARQANNPRDALATILRTNVPPTPTTLAPAPTPTDLDVIVSEDEVTFTIGTRRYRVRGLAKNLSVDQMKVNLLANNDHGLFVDTLDLYSAKHRRSFIQQTAQELGIEDKTVKKDVGQILLHLEQLQEEQMNDVLNVTPTTPDISDDDREEALAFLRDPNLLQRIVADMPIVGEDTNKLVSYLAAVSRKLDDPLAVIVQSSTAAGKTTLMEAALAFVPPEDRIKYSAMTGQSLFYMAEDSLKHKILAIVEEEGAERASYALKLLQSEGELMIASTGKEGNTGRMVTQTYTVEGPVMIFLTTTAIKIDEELLNRCLVLTVDEDREQTKAIHQLQRQRQTLTGLLAAKDQRRIRELHHNAQRLLRPLLVANPYAESLTFINHKTRTRRDHQKYLALIRVVTLLHQYQRPIYTTSHQGTDVEYIEVTLEDIEVANKLATVVLGRCLDELPPQTRCLLDLIDKMVTDGCQRDGVDREDYRFRRRDVREYTGWGHSQLAIHMRRLEQLEYVLVHRGQRGRSFVYELLYHPTDQGQHFLTHLIDVDQLRCYRPGSND